ncbi:MAG: DUF4199 family protein [Rhodothermales bacterium]|nr:DUF4199 family protein [Rhodothermales bacterium]MBO6780172.1 DUF4199 family protein [Rhodothermales bacterium]
MPSKQQSIILGGAIVGLLSTSYLGFINILCCAGVLTGAVVAVWHYTSTHELTLSGGQGAGIGVQAALVGWLIAFVLNFVLMSAGVRHDLMMAEWSLANFGDQMQPEQLDQIEEQINTPFGVGSYLKMTLASVNGVIGIVLTALFGAIGGAIGAAAFKKGPEEEAAA